MIKEEKAVRAYDLAAPKYWGPITITNFLLLINLKNTNNFYRLNYVINFRF